MGGLPTGTVNSLAVAPGDPRVMYVALRSGLFRSADAGERWTKLDRAPREVAALAVHPERPAEVYAATSQGAVWVSADGGMRWASRQPRGP